MNGNSHPFTTYCDKAAWVRVRIQGMPSPDENQNGFYNFVITIFVGTELLNFTPTGWTEAEHVHFVSYNYVILA
jgi:hypothetical protein